MAANITLNILDVPTSGRWTHAMPIMLFCLTDAGWELWRRVVPGAGPRPEVSRGNRLVWWLRWLV